MAAAAFILRRALLSAPAANIRTIRAFSFRTAVRRTTTALKSGRTAAFIGIPTLSILGHEVYQRVQRVSVVRALEQEELLEQADYLYSCAETEKLLQLLRQHKNRDDAEFLWRLARATRDVALLPDTAADTKKQLIYESYDCAKRALEKDEGCFAAHKWFAICLSDKGDYEGIKVKLGNSFIIRDHLQRAIELNPKDATTLYILGFWCFAFADLPWYQRKVASVIFATPPESSFEEALSYFLKAEEVDPNFYGKNLLMLGKTYLKMNDKETAKLWLSKAIEFPALTHEDKEAHKEAVDLLKSLG